MIFHHFPLNDLNENIPSIRGYKLGCNSPTGSIQNLVETGELRLNYRLYLDILSATILYLIYYYDLYLKESIKSTFLQSICGFDSIRGPSFLTHALENKFVRRNYNF